ncbi:MAG: LegC family aminotransferase [Candidatus Omnitrophica bacterium]|nr:LegC family aminotransferase [Candidatus Omnitrophota bacterium]
MNKDNSSDHIPLSVPHLDGNEWAYVKECLDTNWVSSAGKYVEKFEARAASYVGRQYGVACVNGTSALHVGLLVAGVGADDEVVMPPLTFVAPANAVRYTGAYPVFVDVRPDTWQLDVGKVAEFLKEGCHWSGKRLVNKKTGRTVKAILPVHLIGHAVDMDPLMALAREFDLVVVEDNAESLGAAYRGRKVGSHGLIACLSFNGNKVITCGGGGMVLTDDRQLADRVRYLTTQAKDDPVENIHGAIGYNYRLTNMQAAMGLAQLEQLDSFVARKRQIARRYQSELAQVAGIVHQQVAGDVLPSYWLYTILIDKKTFGLDSREVMQSLRQAGIESRPFWHPLHSQKVFADCYSFNVSAADRLYREALSLPSSVGMTDAQQDRVIDLIRSLGSASGSKK